MSIIRGSKASWVAGRKLMECCLLACLLACLLVSLPVSIPVYTCAVNTCVCLPLYLSTCVCLPLCLSTCVCLPFYLSTCVCLPLHLSTCPSICVRASLPSHPPTCLPAPAYLSTHAYLFSWPPVLLPACFLHTHPSNHSPTTDTHMHTQTPAEVV